MNYQLERKTGPRAVDCHMHTTLCGHAVGEPLEYVRAAAEKGIELITFTCHIPMRWEAFGQEGIRMRREQLPEYLSLIARTAEEAQALGVEVLTGIEAEIFPDAEELVEMDAILAEHDFDVVLGSLHHQCASYQTWIDRNNLSSESAIIHAYFEHLAEGVRSGRYDTVAHPDLIRIYGTVEPFEPADYEEPIRAFLSALVECDHCMEVNTSGLTKGVYIVHPDPLILRWAAEMGVKLTIGSDSHRPASVGQFFPTIVPLLRETGFEHLHYFRKRERCAVSLDVMVGALR